MIQKFCKKVISAVENKMGKLWLEKLRLELDYKSNYNSDNKEATIIQTIKSHFRVGSSFNYLNANYPITTSFTYYTLLTD
ncbi:MAG: hypothetical protein Q7T12_00515 [Flavobacterium sp.]|nr:hypothetical protein [Flavobacterium sp.]